MKHPLLLAILLLVTPVVRGQIVKAIRISGGPVSANENRAIGGNPVSYSMPLYSWGAEVGLVFIQEKYFSVGTSTGLIQKGYSWEYPAHPYRPGSFGLSTLVKTRLRYLYFLPRFTGHYKMKRITWLAFTGPRWDFFAGASETDYRNNQVVKEDKKGANGAIDFYNNYHRIAVFGWTAGIGAEKRLGKRLSISLEAAYWLDITHTVRRGYTPFDPEIYARNKAATAWITINYSFLKKQ